MLKLPTSLESMVHAIHKHGGRCIIVGGFVRDSILNIQSKDIDIEVFQINSYESVARILKPFGRVNLVGKSFGVLKISHGGYDVDFSLPRMEKKISAGHKGFEVIIDTSMEFKEAAKRRDFTINAIGYDTKTKTLLDPYNGLKDLKNHLLNYIDEQTFIEDPLRVFRALQFCARFSLQCSDSLTKACCYLCDNALIEELPKERIYEEFIKLLTLGKTPSIGLKLFEKFHLISYYPELLEIKNDFVYLDVMAKMRTDDSKQNLILMLSVLVFDFQTKEQVNSFLRRFLDEKFIISEVLNFYIHKDSFATILKENFGDYDLYLLSTKVTIKYLLSIHKARGRAYDAIKSRASKLGILSSSPKPLLQGRDLIEMGLQPSALFSTLLDKAYDAQLRGYFTTHEDAKKWIKKSLT